MNEAKKTYAELTAELDALMKRWNDDPDPTAEDFKERAEAYEAWERDYKNYLNEEANKIFGKKRS